MSKVCASERQGPAPVGGRCATIFFKRQGAQCDPRFCVWDNASFQWWVMGECCGSAEVLLCTPDSTLAGCTASSLIGCGVHRVLAVLFRKASLGLGKGTGQSQDWNCQHLNIASLFCMGVRRRVLQTSARQVYIVLGVAIAV
jgi:hypothetical protein